MRKIRIFFVVLLIVSAPSGFFLRHYLFEKEIDERPFLDEVAPGREFSEKAGNPPHYASGEDLVVFNTFEVVPSIKGYAGPIKLLLALRNDGSITGVKILGHKETKNFVHYMESPEYLGQFLGKSVNDPFRVEGDIDGISAATVSVEALARTVRDSSRRMAGGVFGIEVRGDVVEEPLGAGWLVYIVLFLSALWFYFLTRRRDDLHRWRDVFLLASIGVLGVYLSSPFSILHVFNLLLRGLPPDVLSYALLLSVALGLAVAGRHYCGWLCPFGAALEFIGRLPVGKWGVPAGADDGYRMLKYVFLALVLVLVPATGAVRLANYETYVTLFSFHGSVLAWALVAAMALAGAKVPRFWCRYLCPVGAFTGLLSRQRRGYVSTRDCPMGNKPMPLTSECIMCNRCYRP